MIDEGLLTYANERGFPRGPDHRPYRAQKKTEADKSKWTERGDSEIQFMQIGGGLPPFYSPSWLQPFARGGRGRLVGTTENHVCVNGFNTLFES